ncbi:MAG: helix-turn-helix domain-containing protein [Streptosporangiaceae bacterium]
MPTPREQLASTLRDSRLAAGYASHGALAKRLNVSRPVITRAESTAHPVPSDALLAAWAGATGAPLDSLNDLAQQARSGIPDWFMPYRLAEGEAHTLRCWAPTVVPGLFQCESYARAILSVERHPPGKLDELVAARLERAQVIGRAVVTAIMDERVIRRLIGTPAVMAEQCAHLVMLGERPDIAIHLLPESSNLGTWGALDIATKDGTVTVCLTTLEDVTSTAENMTIKAMQAFDRILGAASPCADSLGYIRTAEQEWKTQI